MRFSSPFSLSFFLSAYILASTTLVMEVSKFHTFSRMSPAVILRPGFRMRNSRSLYSKPVSVIVRPFRSATFLFVSRERSLNVRTSLSAGDVLLRTVLMRTTSSSIAKGLER